MKFLVSIMSLLRSSMRCVMRSRGVIGCPAEPSCSVGRSLLGRVVSLSECTRCSGRAEIPRPVLLPGNGGFVRSPRTPSRGRTLPWRDPPWTADTGADGPRSDVGPGAVYGRGVACGMSVPGPSRGPGHHEGPRCAPARWGAVPMLPQAPGPPLVRPFHQHGPTVMAGPLRARGTLEGPRRRTQVTLPQEPGNDRRPFSSARPHRVLRTLTSSSGRRSGPGHGLPLAARAAVAIVEGNLFPAPARHITPLVPRHRGERGPSPREACSRSRGDVGFPVFIFLPHKNSVFEPVWKTGRRYLGWSDAMAAFRMWSELDAAPNGRNSVNASRVGRSLGCVFPKSPRGRRDSPAFGGDVRPFVWAHARAEAFGTASRVALWRADRRTRAPRRCPHTCRYETGFTEVPTRERATRVK